MAYPASVNVAVAVAMDDGACSRPSWPTPTNRPLFPLAAAGPTWWPAPHQTASSQPEYSQPAPFNLSNLGCMESIALMPCRPGTGAILAVAASRPCVVGGSGRSISVKRQMQVNLTGRSTGVIYGTHGRPSSRILPP